MKKLFSLFLLMLLLGGATSVSASEQVKSEVGISFYQPTNKNQVVPMEKVSIGDHGMAVGPKTLPKTGEERPFLLQGFGVLLLGVATTLYFLKKNQKDKRDAL
ncbi:LPXTG cell wall anchor domain-containing protein [Enterococcus gallinarum]|uniref:LPXTG cell wall anchor domain-containing protein n=1 Tax=Enterococcus gallinarum TaxID=1353 RepID=UPI001D1719B0|nr:LPXTG cell wall anchor domain-containing protein [Enterococcus gallinarum]MCC4043714.1 LPXTG cell wall anchor domain-containing protein [Enterococcus gallinarum]